MAKRIYIRLNTYILNGGPFDGKRVRMESPGTLTFTCNGMTGRYNRENVWEPIK